MLIRTNNVPRLLLDWDQLTTREQAQGNMFPGWHGYAPDSYFSGVLIRWPDGNDNDRVIMATYT